MPNQPGNSFAKKISTNDIRGRECFGRNCNLGLANRPFFPIIKIGAKSPAYNYLDGSLTMTLRGI
jgi:hypothetical protein